MSSALAVAGVTAVLRGSIESWLGSQNANAALGGANADVTAVAPDSIELSGPNAGPRLNLFLHHVTPNPGWRNVELPSASDRGDRMASPPLALDLHYLLTAYGTAELQAEVLLGLGMQRLHMFPVLQRDEIDARLPTELRSSMLGRQVELIRITPEPIPTEELSRLWTALQAHYRPSAGYSVSVVLIEAPAEGRAPQPVLSRGPFDPVSKRERGVVANPSLSSGLPGITQVQPPGGQAGAALGQDVVLSGHDLSGSGHTVVLESRMLEVRREIAATAADAASVTFTVPNAPAQLPVGDYSIWIRLIPPGAAVARETNRLVLTVLPRLLSVTSPVALNAQGEGIVIAQVRPQVRPSQRVGLILGSDLIPAEAHPTTTGTLSFRVRGAVAGSYIAGIRVDGIDSNRVDRTAVPPAFVGPTVVLT